MLNDSSVLSSSFSAVMSKKGGGAFKKFQARLKHSINNIDVPQITEKVTTVWDKLRGRK